LRRRVSFRGAPFRHCRAGPHPKSELLMLCARIGYTPH
jgi:hypothetical protein